MLLKEIKKRLKTRMKLEKKFRLKKRCNKNIPKACYNKVHMGLREACRPLAIIFFRPLFLKKEFHSQSIAALNTTSCLTKDQRNISNCFIVYMNN